MSWLCYHVMPRAFTQHKTADTGFTTLNNWQGEQLYLQCTTIGWSCPARLVRTRATKSRKSVESSGTPWSGQARYWIWVSSLCCSLWTHTEKKKKKNNFIFSCTAFQKCFFIIGNKLTAFTLTSVKTRAYYVMNYSHPQIPKQVIVFHVGDLLACFIELCVPGGGVTAPCLCNYGL